MWTSGKFARFPNGDEHAKDPGMKLVSRFTSAAFDSDDLAGLDGLEVSEASGHERNEVFQEDGFTTETDPAIFRCTRFCWYSNPRSTVRRTSNFAASAAVKS